MADDERGREVEMKSHGSVKRISDFVAGLLESEDDVKGLPLTEIIKEKMIQSLPPSTVIDGNDLKLHQFGCPLAVAYLAVHISLFLYFIISGTQDEMDKQYLSLPPAPKPSAATCKEVPVILTGNFLGDYSGVWSTQASYEPQQSLYRIDLTGTAVNNAYYTKAVTSFGQELQAIGAKTSTMDTITKLIGWTVWYTEDPAHNIAFTPDADLETVFIKTYAYSAIALSNRGGICFDTGPNPNDELLRPFIISSEGLPVPQYDPSTMQMTLASTSAATLTALDLTNDEPPYSDDTATSYVSNDDTQTTRRTTLSKKNSPPTGSPTSKPSSPAKSLEHHIPLKWLSFGVCKEQVSCVNGSNPLGGCSSTSTTIDIRSLATVYALNFGIINTTQLTEVNTDHDDGVIDNEKINYYVDPAYPTMSRIKCYEKESKRKEGKRKASLPVCLTSAAGAQQNDHDSLVYPIFTSFAGCNNTNSNGVCQACRCSKEIGIISECLTSGDVQIVLAFSRIDNSMDVVDLGRKMLKLMATKGAEATFTVNRVFSDLGLVSAFFSNKINGFKNVKEYKQAYEDWKKGKDVSVVIDDSIQTISHLPTFKDYQENFDNLDRKSISLLTITLNLGKMIMNGGGVTIDKMARKFNDSASVTVTDMCQDYMYQSSALQALAEKPPLTVVQPYIVCNATFQAAIVTAAGTANANSESASNIFLTLAIITIVGAFNLFYGEKILPPDRKAKIEAEIDKLKNDDLVHECHEHGTALEGVQDLLLMALTQERPMTKSDAKVAIRNLMKLHLATKPATSSRASIVITARSSNNPLYGDDEDDYMYNGDTPHHRSMLVPRGSVSQNPLAMPSRISINSNPPPPPPDHHRDSIPVDDEEARADYISTYGGSIAQDVIGSPSKGSSGKKASKS